MKVNQKNTPKKKKALLLVLVLAILVLVSAFVGAKANVISNILGAKQDLFVDNSFQTTDSSGNLRFTKSVWNTMDDKNWIEKAYFYSDMINTKSVEKFENEIWGYLGVSFDRNSGTGQSMKVGSPLAMTYSFHLWKVPKSQREKDNVFIYFTVPKNLGIAQKDISIYSNNAPWIKAWDKTILNDLELRDKYGVDWDQAVFGKIEATNPNTLDSKASLDYIKSAPVDKYAVKIDGDWRSLYVWAKGNIKSASDNMMFMSGFSEPSYATEYFYMAGIKPENPVDLSKLKQLYDQKNEIMDSVKYLNATNAQDFDRLLPEVEYALTNQDVTQQMVDRLYTEFKKAIDQLNGVGSQKLTLTQAASKGNLKSKNTNTLVYESNNPKNNRDVQLLVQAPQNNVDGSKFNGGVSLDRVVIKDSQYDNTKLYINPNYTYKKEASIDTSKDGWQEIFPQVVGSQLVYDLPALTTGTGKASFVVKATGGKTLTKNVEYEYSTYDNEGGNTYTFKSMSLMPKGDVKSLTTGQVKYVVYSRTIEGMVFIDDDKSGKYEFPEFEADNVEVRIVSANGGFVFNEYGQSVKSTKTDSDGRYKFEHLKAGEYYIEYTPTKDQSVTGKFTKIGNTYRSPKIILPPIESMNSNVTKTMDVGIALEILTHDVSTSFVNGQNARPEQVEIEILRDGVVFKTVTLDRENGWTTKVEVPNYKSNFIKYNYTTRLKTPIPNFESKPAQFNEFEIINTYIPPKGDFTGSVTFVNGPEDVTADVQLVRNGVPQVENEKLGITRENGSNLTWKNLPLTDENGNPIRYTLGIKNAPANFEQQTSNDGRDVTLTYKSPKIVINVEKAWVGGSTLIPDNVEVGLYRNGQFYKKFDVTREEDWSTKLHGINQTNDKGEVYKYTIKEITPLEHFTSSVNNFEIKSVYIIPTGDYDVKVEYVGGRERPIPTIKLLKGKEVVNQSQAENGYEASFLVDQTDFEGVPITYSFEASDLPNFTKQVFESERKVVYTYVSPKMNFTGAVSYVGGNLETPLRVQLVANGQPVEGKIQEGITKQNVVVSFPDVPQYDQNGDEIEYSLQALDLPANYTQSTSPNGKTLIITYGVPHKDITINKKWVNGEIKIPRQVTIDVFQDGKPYSQEILRQDQNWTKTLKDLPETKEDGTPIVYTAKETQAVPNFAPSAEALNVTNTYQVPQTKVQSIVEFVGGKTNPQVDIVLKKSVNGQWEEAQTKQVHENGIITFDAPLTDERGNNIPYMIVGKDTPNYNLQNTPGKVIYTYESPKINLETQVEVKNGPEQIDLDIQLFANGQKVDNKVKTITGKGTKQVVFEDVPEFDINGDKIAYSIQATNLSSSYTQKQENDGKKLVVEFVVKDQDIAYEIIGLNGAPEKDLVIKLLRNGEVIKEVPLKETKDQADWNFKGTFANLPLTDESGKDYEYTSEVVAEGYKVESATNGKPNANFTIVYSVRYEPPVGKLELTKQWNGGQTLLPDEVQVQLMNNTTPGPLFTITKDQEWKLTTPEVPLKTNKAQDISYTLKEITNVENFTATVEGLKVINTYNVPKETFKKQVQIVNGPEETKTKVYLVIDGQKQDDRFVEVSKTNPNVQFENLPSTKEDGTKINYTIDVDVPQNYEKQVQENGDIKLVYKSPKTQVTVKKQWVNGETVRPAEVEFELYKNTEKIQDVTLTKQDGWSKQIKELDKTDSKGVDYKYTVKEKTDIPNFTKQEQDLTVTNTYKVPMENVDAKVVFVGGPKDTKVSVKLLADNNQVEGQIKENITRANGTIQFANQPATKENGDKISYKIDLVEVPENYKKEISENGLQITLTYQAPEKQLLVKKVWDKGQTLVPEQIELEVKKDNAFLENVTLTKQEQFAKTLNVPEFTNDGVKITYTVDEKNVPENFVKEIENKENELVVTNRYVVPTTTFTKQVEFIGGKQDVQTKAYLVADGQKQDDKSVEVSKTNPNAQFTNLPLTKEDGTPIVYTIDVDTPENYEKQVQANGNIKLVYKSPKTQVTVEKQWVNGDNVRPEEVDFELLQNGKPIQDVKVTKQDSWTKQVQDLDKTDQNGVDYKYTVKEKTNVENFEVKVQENGLSVTNTYKIPQIQIGTTVQFVGGKDDVTTKAYLVIDGKQQEEKFVEVSKTSGKVEFKNLPATKENGDKINYTIEVVAPDNYGKEVLNDGALVKLVYGSPKTQVTIKKQWVNGEKVRPDEVTFELLRNGQKLQEETLTKDQNFQKEVQGLDKTDAKGADYKYTVKEITDVENFTKQVEDDGLTVTNSYVVPKETFKKQVQIVNGPEDTKTKVYLVIDGQKQDDRFVEVSKTNPNVQFENLPSTKENGTKINYTIDVDVPENFEKQDLEDGNVKLTYKTPKTQVTVKKQWVNGETVRPTEVEFELYKNTEKIQDVTLTKQEGWSKQITELDKTDQNGVDYKYTVKEKTNIANFEKQEQDLTVTNTYKIPQTQVSTTVQFVGGKPDITTKAYLVIDGEKQEDQFVEVSNKNGKVEFKNLPATKENGEKINYTIDVVAPENYGKQVENEGQIVKLVYGSPKTQVTIKKQWVNGEKVRPEEVKFDLLQNGRKIQEETLTKEQNFQKEVQNLDKTDAKGIDFVYTVRETSDIPNFEKQEDGLVVTNSYVIPTTTFTKQVEFVGGKNDVQTKAYLVIDGQKQANQFVEVSKTNGKVEFKNLPETKEDGTPIVYTIDVDTPENFEKQVQENGNIKLVYKSPKTQITVEKQWVNGDNVRPEEVDFELLQNGKPIQDVKVTKQDSWTKQVSELDKTDQNGVDYKYTVKEKTNVENFESKVQENGLIIKNTYKIPQTQISTTVQFVGGTNDITTKAYLVIDGQKQENKVVEVSKTSGKVEFKNLPATKENGDKINYTIDVVAPDNYGKEVENDGALVKLVYGSPKTQITVQKQWVNGKNMIPETVEFELYKNSQKVQDITLSKNEGWTKQINDLPKTDENGTNYTYTVKEKGQVENFAKEENGLVVTNSYVIPKTTFEKQVTINGGPKGSQFVVDLIANDRTISGKSQVVEKLGQDYTYTKTLKYTDLDKTDINGNEISYKIDITQVPENYEKQENDGNIVLTYKSPKTTLNISKQWVNGESVIPENITLDLLQNGRKIQDVTLTKQESWTKQVTQDATDENGNAYTYTVDETNAVPNFTKKVSNNGNTLQVTNTYSSPQINVDANVIINGGLLDKQIKVNLLANGVVIPGNEKTLSRKTQQANSQIQFANLPKTDKDGKDINYTLALAENLENYESKLSEDGKTLTLTYVSPKINITVEKAWVGGDNIIPENIEVMLLANGKQSQTFTVTKQDGWTKQITNLPEFDENGIKIQYTVKEITELEHFTNKVENFKITNIYQIPSTTINVNVQVIGGTNDQTIEVILNKEENGQTTKVDQKVFEGTNVSFQVPETTQNATPIKYTIDGTNLPNYEKRVDQNTRTITYTYISPKITKNANVIFQGGKDASVSIKLLANGTPTGKVVENVTKNTKMPIIFDELNLTTPDGKVIEYSIEQVALPANYVKVPSTDPMTLVLKYVSPKISFTAQKQWVGGSKVKPDITLELIKDGVEVVNSQRVLKFPQVQVTWQDLDKTDENGNDFVYSVKEKGQVENYQRKYVGNDTVVNTYVSPVITVSGTITVNGGSNDQKATIQLLQNGKVLPSKTMENVNIAKVTNPQFTDLPKTDENGNEYVYTIDVVNLPDTYTKKISQNGKDITLTYVSPKISLEVVKKWKDGESLIPDSIKAMLMQNGKEFKEITLTKENGWKQVVEDLDKTDESAKDYVYTVKEITNVENFEKDENGLVITNTYVVPTKQITVNVNYVHGSKTKPQTTISLFANGNFVKDITFKPSQDANQSETITVDQTNSKGEKLTYTVKQENTPENYVANVSGLSVTNTYVSPKTNYPVTIEYVNGEKLRQEVEVQLLQNGKPFGQTMVITPKAGQNTYNVDFNNLDQTDLDANKYEYSIEVINNQMPNFEVKKQQDKQKELVTLTYKVPQTKLTGSIDFVNGPSQKPQIDVEILQNGKPIQTVKVKDGKYEATLPQTDESGTPYEYSVRMPNVKDGKIQDYIVKQNDDSNFTLTYESPKADVKGKVDIYGKSGNDDLSVKVELYENGKPTGIYAKLTSSLEYTFENMPIYDQNGKKITYTVKIVGEVNGFDVQYKDGKAILIKKELKGHIPFAGHKNNIYIIASITSLAAFLFIYKKHLDRQRKLKISRIQTRKTRARRK